MKTPTAKHCGRGNMRSAAAFLFRFGALIDMRRTPMQKEPLESRIARRAAELLEQADGLTEGSKERLRLERRVQQARHGLANPLEPTDGPRS
jgi:hypothetical protein